jgi:formylglycine-generating enzyme required for sulfatase activity
LEQKKFGKAREKHDEWAAYVEETLRNLSERAQVEEFLRIIDDAESCELELRRQTRIDKLKTRIELALTGIELEQAGRLIEELSTEGPDARELELLRQRLAGVEQVERERQRQASLDRIRDAFGKAILQGNLSDAAARLAEIKSLASLADEYSPHERALRAAEAEAQSRFELENLKAEADTLMASAARSVSLKDYGQSVQVLSALVSVIREIKKRLPADADAEFMSMERLQLKVDADRLRIADALQRQQDITVGEEARKKREIEDRRLRLVEEEYERKEQEMTLRLSSDGRTSARVRLVSVSGGVARVGSSPTDELARPNEQPVDDVSLEPYLIGRFPITVEQFYRFVSDSSYSTTAEKEGWGMVYARDDWREVHGASWRAPRGPGSDVRQKASHPVTQVSWDDAIAFCDWLSGVSGRRVRLPTEAEWEYAARGPESRIWAWGNQPPNVHTCNFGNKSADTSRLEEFQGASFFGCLDMSGNVWEWTSSLFAPYPYRSGDDTRELRTTRSARVLRGGSFLRRPEECRAAYRHMNLPTFRSVEIGFRVRVAPLTAIG